MKMKNYPLTNASSRLVLNPEQLLLFAWDVHNVILSWTLLFEDDDNVQKEEYIELLFSFGIIKYIKHKI